MSIKPSQNPLYKKRTQNITVTTKDKNKSVNISIIILTFASVAIALIMLTFIFMDKLDSQIKKRIEQAQKMNYQKIICPAIKDIKQDKRIIFVKDLNQAIGQIPK